MECVLRPRLFQAYNRNPNWKITVIQAPMGSGKSFLLKEWQKYYLADEDCLTFPVIAPSAADDEEATIADIRELLLGLHERAGVAQSYLLIDDFDFLLTAGPASRIFALIRFSPPSCHFVLAGLSFANTLYRSLADKTIQNIPVGQLALSREETGVFAKALTGGCLGDDDVSYLHQVSGGWPLGVRFAAQSYKQYRGSYQMTDFNGSDEFVDTYFRAWVFDTLPEELVAFSLQTALLETLNPSLCDYVTERIDSSFLLEKLAQKNPFLMRLNNQGAYRYSRLYGDWLQRQIQQLDAARIRSLATRASQWYAENNEDFNEARMLVLATDAASMIPLLKGSFLSERIHVPSDLYSQVLSFALSLDRSHALANALLATWAFIGFGRYERIKTWDLKLQELAERFAPDSEKAYYALVHEVSQATIHAIVHHNHDSIALCRDVLAGMRPNPNPMIAFHLYYSLADACERVGEYSAATDYCLQAYACAMASGATDSATFPNYKNCKLLLAQGRFREIKKICDDSLKLANPDSSLRRAFFIMSALIEIEALNLEDAKTNLANGTVELTSAINPEIYIEAMIAKSELLIAQESYNEAYEELLQVVMRFADVQLPAAAMSFVYIALGRVSIIRRSSIGLKEALKWLVPATELEDWNHRLYIRCFELISAYFENGPATASLNGLRVTAEESRRRGFNTLFIECRLAMATICFAQGDRAQAFLELLPALEMGLAHGYHLTIINGGEAVFELLQDVFNLHRDADELQHLLDYLRSLMQLFYTRTTSSVSDCAALTAREQEVLRMLNAGKSRTEISDSLFISINTTKAHIRSIHKKLKSTSLSEATE